MNPITLRMKAFGSFAKETTVSFRDFRNGLFLVVGDTGAGKTTIFDAIVFALYGVASGSSRKAEMMHSDYVPKSEDTEVTLAFEQGGKEYTVTRSIHFRKKRGTDSEYAVGTLNALLCLPEGKLVEGATKVTARCEELLGLNAEQFRRIVMLAQGEFRKFLSANAKEKSEILGRLFDNSEYVRFQNLLEQSRDALKRRRSGYEQAIETQMNTVFQRPERSDVLYLPGESDLMEQLDRLIASEEQKAAELDAVKDQTQRAVDALNKKKGAAEGNNHLLETLAETKRHLEELTEKQEKMERLQREYERAEKALRQCVPQQEKWEAAKARARQTEQAIQSLQQTVCALEEQCSARQATVEGDQSRKQRVDEISIDGKRLADSLPQYDRLEETHRQRERSEKQLYVLTGELGRKQGLESETKNALMACQSELTQLENAGAEELSRKSEYETARKAVEDFNRIAADVKAVQQSEKTLARDKTALKALSERAGAASDEYNRLYHLFIDGQAGWLASELANDLAEKGKALCPVCHSVFCAGETHDFAALVEGTPTQDEVNEARARLDRAEKERSEKKTAVETREATLLVTRETILTRAKNLLPNCESWKQLSASDFLVNALAQLNRARDEAKAWYDAAKKKRLRQSELNGAQKRLARELETLSGEIRQKTDTISQVKVQIASLKAEEETLRKGLAFAGKREAGARLQELRNEYKELRAVIDRHQKALEEVTKQLNNARGGLQEKVDSLPEQQMEAVRAQSTFVAALARNGFENAEEMGAALTPIGEETGELWLKRRHQTLIEYKNDCENTRSRVAELTDQTKDLSYTNLGELNQKLEDAKAGRDAAEQASSAQSSLLRNHRQVRGSVAAARGELNRTDKAWERLNRLAELATGVSGDGGKLSFERYVMGSIFREVLDMANRRLDIMSGGHYQLVHETNAGRRNAVAGLEIEVLDVSTGKQRLANSLSGGESFQVSLSLALGLSDVVQSHAGGIGLDTVFIDEGFGALDGSALDSAITVLHQLTEGDRLVGIISHVDKLEESIPQKLRVRKTAAGSELSVELS